VSRLKKNKTSKIKLIPSQLLNSKQKKFRQIRFLFDLTETKEIYLNVLREISQVKTIKLIE
jgi:hypothetical protein